MSDTTESDPHRKSYEAERRLKSLSPAHKQALLAGLR